MTESQPRRGRPRASDVDDRILATARTLLREGGPRAVHIDAVAARSGIARTTIYRRYRDRRQLLSATMEQVTDQGAPPQEGDLEDKVRWVLERAREVVTRGIGRGGVAAVLTDADPDFTDALRASLSTHLQPVTDAMTSDAARGLLRRDVDPDGVVDLAFGACLAELLRYGEERADWIERTTALLARALRAD
jgi:AcrR family transcriptional regulator